MKKRLFGVLAFALAVSAGAAFVLYQLIASKMTVGASTTKQATTKVLVAAKDLELGALITERDVITQDYLTVPAGAILKKEDIVGRGVTTPVHQDAPFYENALAPKGAGAGFAATIPTGMRAFAVHVNEVVGVAGFAVAGMHVDVLVAGSPPGGTENVGAVTRTLMQDLQVLSAGQNYQKDAEGKPVLVQVVNLLVTPEQAEILNLATQQTIQLVLRNPADTVIVNTPGASTLNLFTGGKIRAPRVQTESESNKMAAYRPPPPPLPVIVKPTMPQTVTIEVFSGSHRAESTFKNPDAPSAIPAVPAAVPASSAIPAPSVPAEVKQ
jgi:pilus assembly protein CpaB